MDNEKQQRSPTPRSGLSKKLHYLQKIEKESYEANKEFSRIAEDESKRTQQVAEIENERIMKERKTNGTYHNCPICLEEIPAIESDESEKQSTNMYTMCCNTIHCKNCADTSIEFMYGKSGGNDLTNAKCFNCREPVHSPKYWAKDIKPDDKRHWLLHQLAVCYETGTNGLKKNTNKAITLYQRAAELGNAFAQERLAQLHYYGDGVPKCLEKARCYAEKAVDQGRKYGQHILGLLSFRKDDLKGGFHFLTLAAFQGCYDSRFALGKHYEVLMQMGHGMHWRKNLLLSLYWYGKAAHLDSQSPEECRGQRSMIMMACQLNKAMRLLWHPRPNSIHDPLPGYSHVPFCTWALAKGEQNTQLLLKSDEPLLVHSPWKNICANCGRKGEKETLKTCARCKAFHYCSKKCQVEHWKAGHKVDCKVGGHWIEQFFPDIRNTQTPQY